jgi:hypothetical protein
MTVNRGLLVGSQCLICLGQRGVLTLAGRYSHCTYPRCNLRRHRSAALWRCFRERNAQVPSSCLKKSIAIEPTLARTHTSLAWAYARLMVFQSDMGPTVRLVLAEARRAAELDPLDARAHTAIGYALGIAGDSSKPRSNMMSTASQPV